MNKRLTTIFMTLLLCILGATNAWAQSSKVYVYSNNLTFINPSNSSYYAGVAKEYRVRSVLYDNANSGILSKLVNPNYVVKIMVPAGTKYLHFHIMGGNGTFKVRSDLNTYMENTDLPDPSSILDTSSSSDVTFTERPGIPFYKVVTFPEPLEQNTQITFISRAAFFVFGINYEDLDGKGTSANPFTAGEAYALARDHVKPTGKVYVKGMVSTASQLADGKLSFSLSDDGSHENEIAVSNCLNIDGENFESEYQVLPRDKVTLQCNILTPINKLLTNGKLISQVHPKYAAIVERNGTSHFYEMMVKGDNYADHYLHSCTVGHLAAGVGSNFYFEETYSDDASYRKSFYGPASSSNYYSIGWENMDNVPLTADTGSKMCVDTEGDGYVLNVKQVADGPKLDVGGFVPRPVYWLCYNDNGDVMLKFHDNGDGTYTLTNSGLDWDDGFWFHRQLGNGPIEYYGCDTNYTNMPLHKYNSTGVAIDARGTDFKMQSSVSEKTFTITETAEGPELTITGWPESCLSFAYDPCDGSGPTQAKVPFDYDKETDTYSFTYTVSKTGGFYFIDNPFGVSFSPATAEDFILSRHNSTDILATLDGSPYFKTINDGTYTFKLTPFNDSYLLTVEGWPEPIYKPSGRNGYMPAFVKNDDSSYSTTINVTEEMIAQHEDYSFDIYEETEDKYYGTSLVEGGLNRYNCVDLPLGTGEEGYSNITLYEAGEYTLTISPDFKLSIDWPHKDYVLNYRSSTNENMYSVPFEYYAGTYTANVSLKKGDGFWVSDETGIGYGIDTQESEPTVDAINASGLTLVPSGIIAAIQATNSFTFTMQEDETSNNLIMDITGWLVNNSNLEGSNMSCFFMAETPESTHVPARVVDGAGVDGTRGIVINSIDNRANEWDSQFFIRLSEALPEGTKYRISFDYKASQDASVLVQNQGEPGEYIIYNAFGTEKVNFTTDWQHFDIEGTSPSSNMRTFDFMLAVNKDATTFFFDNIVVEADLPEPEPEPTMIDIIKNGNIEGTDMSCFFKKEPISIDNSGSILPATFTAGVGVDGSRGIVVNSIENANASAWDAQFFVRLPQTLPEGTKYRISFDYKANKDATVSTQVQGEPGYYIWYVGIGDIYFTDEWQHFEKTGAITTKQSPSDNMRTFAFNLSENKSATSFYFDNIKVEIDEAHVVLMGDVNGDGTVSIQDVVLVVDYALKKPVSGFVLEAADVTGDGQVDVSDVVGIVNLVLKKSN